ncbi:MAG TPA: hypothetical protein VH268_07270 [Solirubrobacterales bacterium]|jgi:hypothetical protein|nr:hypothetical protein [Solirubrobacterales bacterium]
MKKSFRRPSPALVIAILALVLALGGTAVAAKRYLITNTKQISPAALKQLTKLAAKEVKRGPAGAAGATGAAGAAGASGERGAAGPGAVVYWAVVNPDGSLARHGTSETAVEKIGSGSYVVKFDTDVTQCAYEAAIGRSEPENTENPGYATVVARSGEPHGVLVQTYNVSPALEDKGFHLAVFC